MTRVDFYVLPDDSDANRVDMVCRLAEKAYRQSKRVYIHTDDAAMAALIDDALWHFREESFVPHSTVTPEIPAMLAEPVEIGFHANPETSHAVLINVGQEVPPFFSRFERTLEVVNQHESVRSTGRTRYSFYQQRGYPLQHHKI